MKLNAKKFGKIFAEPNRPKPAEPRTEPKFLSLPNFNNNRFVMITMFKFISCYLMNIYVKPVRLNFCAKIIGKLAPSKSSLLSWINFF